MNAREIQVILVVEDDLSLRPILEKFFKRVDSKIHIQWATSAEDATRGLKEHNVDLILSDYTLAGKNTGLDLWDYCAQSCPKTPFVITSALSPQQFYKRVGRTRSCPAFLPKPFYPTEYLQLLDALQSKTFGPERKLSAP